MVESVDRMLLTGHIVGQLCAALNCFPADGIPYPFVDICYRSFAIQLDRNGDVRIPMVRVETETHIPG